MLEKKYSSLITIIQKKSITDALAVKACFSILSTANRIDKACANRLGYYQLSEGRFMVLVLLLEHNLLSPQEIASLSGVSKPTVSVFLSSLLKDELINKTVASSDGRKVDITLTEKGKDLISTIFDDHSRWIANITEALTDPEIETLIAILNKIVLTDL